MSAGLSSQAATSGHFIGHGFRGSYHFAERWEIAAGCERSVFDLIPAGERVSIERSTFPKLVESKCLFAVQDPAYWLDAGTPATLLQANLDAVDQGATAIDASASIVDSTVERSVVGARSLINGSTVRGSLIMNDAKLEHGCVVEDSIVGDGATIQSGVILRAHTIVGDGVVVPAGTYEGERLS